MRSPNGHDGFPLRVPPPSSWLQLLDREEFYGLSRFRIEVAIPVFRLIELWRAPARMFNYTSHLTFSSRPGTPLISFLLANAECVPSKID